MPLNAPIIVDGTVALLDSFVVVVAVQSSVLLSGDAIGLPVVSAGFSLVQAADVDGSNLSSSSLDTSAILQDGAVADGSLLPILSFEASVAVLDALITDDSIVSPSSIELVASLVDSLIADGTNLDLPSLENTATLVSPDVVDASLITFPVLTIAASVLETTVDNAEPGQTILAVPAMTVVASLGSLSIVSGDVAELSTLTIGAIFRTPSLAAGDVIGLPMSSANISLRVPTSSDLVTNGTFDVDANWTKPPSVTISGGKANCVNFKLGHFFYQSCGLLSNVTYRFECDITASSGIVQVNLGGSIIQYSLSAGHNLLYLSTATANGNLVFTGVQDAAFTGTIDNVRVWSVLQSITVSSGIQILLPTLSASLAMQASGVVDTTILQSPTFAVGILILPASLVPDVSIIGFPTLSVVISVESIIVDNVGEVYIYWVPENRGLRWVPECRSTEWVPESRSVRWTPVSNNGL